MSLNTYKKRKANKEKIKKNKMRKQESFQLKSSSQKTNQTSSSNVASIQTIRKFTTLVFPHLINVTKVLHYKIGQL